MGLYRYIAFGRAHLRPLAHLWSASVIVGAANLSAVLLVMAYAPLDVYAIYTIAQGVSALSAAWSDAGLASAMQVLTVPSAREGHGSRQHAAAGLALSHWIVPLASIATLILVALLTASSHIISKEHLVVLAGFSAAGALYARVSFYSAIIYGQGRFGKYGIATCLGALTRPAIVAIVLLVGDILTIEVLLVAECLSALGAFGAVQIFVRRTLLFESGTNVSNRVRSEVRRFVLPNSFSMFCASLAHNGNVFGASLFATHTSIAAFGVFQRLNQVFLSFALPLVQYAAWKLRRAAGDAVNSARDELRTLVALTVFYLAFASICFFAYRVAAVYFDHYSLKYPHEYLWFLVLNGIGYLVVVLNSLLLARGSSRHLVVGTALQLVLTIALISVVRPDDLLRIILCFLASLVGTVVYYGYVFVVGRRSTGEGGGAIHMPHRGH